MGSLTVFVALTWMVSTVLLCSQAAPVTEFFGAQQIIEDNSNLDYPNLEYEYNKVKEMERFHRTFKNGTVEFKMALSNGHVQYQRISSKMVDGDKVQVFEGYISEQYKDGRYGTRYYAADENGYRSSPVIVENDPPQLPSSGPYSTSLSQNIQNHLSPFNEDDTETKPKTLTDNLAEQENNLEEEQLPNFSSGFNIASENSILTTESELVKHLEKVEILENTNREEASVLQNFNGVETELPLNLDLPSSTELLSTPSSENNYGNAREEGLSISVATDNADKFEASSNVFIRDDEQSGEDKLAGRSFHTTSELQSEGIDDVKVLSLEPIELTSNISTEQPIDEIPKKSTETLLNDEEASSEDVDDVKVPYEERIDNVSSFEVRREPQIDEFPEASTEILLNDDVVPTEQSDTFNNDAHESNTVVPEINEEKTDGKTSRNLRYPIEDSESKSTTLSSAKVDLSDSDELSKALTELLSLEPIEDGSIDSIASETESNSDLPTSRLAPEIENKSTASLNNEAQEPSTDIPEFKEVKRDDESSSVSGYPLETSESESTTLLIADNISKSSAEDEVTQSLTEQSSLENIEGRSIENIPSETESSNSDPLTSNLSAENENQSPATFNNEDQELSTGVPEHKEVKIEAESSSVSGYPLETSEPESTTLSTADNISKSSAEDEVTQGFTEQSSLGNVEGRSIENIPSETESSNYDLPTSNIAAENENRSPVTNNNEDQELSTGVPEFSEVKTEAESSSVSGYPLETSQPESTTFSTADNISKSSAEEEVTQVLTEQPSLENIEGRSLENIPSETESHNYDLPTSNLSAEEDLTKVLTEQPSLGEIEDKSTENIVPENDSDLPTLSPTFEIESKSTEINELPTENSGLSTDLPIDDSTNADDEASGEAPNDHDSLIGEKEGRSFDFFKVLPLPENNLKSNAETNNSATAISSEINEDTTNKIEISSEQPESTEEVSIGTTASGENNNADVTTQKNSTENSSSDNVIEQDTQISTDQPSALLSSEENSNEESKEKSTEDEESTEVPVESSEEKDNTATNIEYSTEAEVLSTTTDETEAKTNGVEVEFHHPVISF